MNKLLIVMPNPQLYVIAQGIVNEAGIEAKVIHNTSETVVEQVRAEMAGHTGVVVARGNQARLVKLHLSVPVVDVVLSGQEMASLLEQACKMAMKPNPCIAFIGFRYMFTDVESIARLANVSANIYYASSTENVPVMVRRAVSEGADVIVGSDNACRYAETVGIKALFMDTMPGSVRDAIRRALHLMDALRLEQRKTAEFMSLLNYSFDAILKLDAQGSIEVVNYMAEKVLHRPGSQLIGKEFLKLSGLQTSDVLTDAFLHKKSLYSTVIRIENDSFVTNVASINVSGNHAGYIVSMKEFGAIDDLEETISQKRRQLGYVAKGHFSHFATKSPRMRQVLEDAALFAQYDVPVLINGEFGTQKKRLAECIHNGSMRMNNPFVLVDLSVLPLHTQTEQIFGSDSGSGLISLAHKGTVYFAHVHLLAEESQHQLWNILQHGHYLRGNSRSPVPVSVRVICSTYADLNAMAQEGRFLLPLAVKLTEMVITMPPVRDCPEDTADLLDSCMARAQHRIGKQAAFTADAIAMLLRHDWPGNNLAIEALCEKASLLARSNQLDAAFVRQHLLPAQQTEAAMQTYVVSSDEERQLRAAIQTCGNDREALMKILGISRSTLWRRMKKYGITAD